MQSLVVIKDMRSLSYGINDNDDEIICRSLDKDLNEIIVLAVY